MVTFQCFNINTTLSHHRNMTQTSAPRALSCPADRSSASPSPGPSSETPRSSSLTRPPRPWTRRARRWASLIKEKKEEKKKQSPLAEAAHFIRRLLQILQARRAGVQLSLPLTSLSFIISIIIGGGGGSQFRAPLATSRCVSCAGLIRTSVLMIAIEPWMQQCDDLERASRSCCRRMRNSSCASTAVFSRNKQYL